MDEVNNYWRRKMLTRRRLLQGAAVGAGALSAAAIIGCGGDEPAATPGGGALGTSGSTATPTARVPAPPEYSKLAPQKLLSEFHWSRAGTQWTAGTPRMGGVFVRNGPASPPTSHPNDEASPLGQWSFCYTHSNLISSDWSVSNNPDLLPATAKYGLAASWEVPDANTFIFRLREPRPWFHNVAPANGAPVTLQDIKATYDFFKTTRFHKANFDMITSIEETTPGVIRFRTSEPAVQLLGQLRTPQYGILNAKHLEEGDEGLKNKRIGTGPFMLQKWDFNKIAVWKRNPNWWWPKDAAGNQLPYLDGIVNQVFSDPTAALAAVRTGQNDYYRPLQIEEFNRLRGELDVWPYVGIGSCVCVTPILSVSHRDQLFRDVRVRRALSMAINRQSIIDDVMGGAASPREWIPHYNRGKWWPDTLDQMGQWYKFDPQGAKTLLQQAGVTTPLKIQMQSLGQLMAGANTLGPTATAESIQRDLKAVGIEVEVKPLDTLSFNRNAFDGKWTGLFNWNEQGFAMDPDIWVQNWVSGSGKNFSGLSDTRVDELFKKQRAAVKEEDRIKIFQELEEYVNRDQLLRGVQLPNLFELDFWSKNVHNAIESGSWELNGGGQTFTAEWWADGKVGQRKIDSF